MAELRIKDIIARLAQPDPLPDLAPLCPDRKELTSVLLDIRKGVKSPFYADLREEACRQHLDVRHLVQKAEFLLTSLNISSNTDYYAVLDLDQDASPEEIHEKWIEKMRMYHPDHYEDPTGWIAEQCRKLNEAYAVLKDPEKRRAYDNQRRAGMRGICGAPGGSHSISSLGDVNSASAVSSRSRFIRAVALGAIAIAGLIVGVLLWSW
ncbi:MAG: J domain-containing protein [candidate division NC10 bacterium]|nr:J domain-containing protein [candidate division NC10 bacterium]MDE2321633.1 J domain-containing protein [candidate division NC10 bacterium]